MQQTGQSSSAFPGWRLTTNDRLKTIEALTAIALRQQWNSISPAFNWNVRTYPRQGCAVIGSMWRELSLALHVGASISTKAIVLRSLYFVSTSASEEEAVSTDDRASIANNNLRHYSRVTTRHFIMLVLCKSVV